MIVVRLMLNVMDRFTMIFITNKDQLKTPKH